MHAKLVTPVGLRSLAPGEPDYKPRYFGDLRARDVAYHRGMVWAWLIGPFIDAWVKVYPDDRAAARQFPDWFEPHLGEAGIGSISEVFDAEPPFMLPRLHRPGLERGRGAAPFGKNRRRAGVNISAGVERLSLPGEKE